MSQPNPTTRYNTLLTTGESFQSSGPPELRPIALPRRLGRMTTVQSVLRSKAVKVSRVWVLWRLLRVAYRSAYFFFGVIWHRLRKLDVEERQKVDARRFREGLERLGGVFIKVGQQMSQRPDVLPPAYCDELHNLLSDIAARIPAADVEAAIRLQTGGPIHEVFARFDWDAIGSASLACVYKARLHTGEVVAVKVRRPGIKEEFTADLDALDWIMHIVEFLTIWRPGMSKNFRLELKVLLLEELDFNREARHQELFRRYHKRRKKLRVTAPKIYYQYSGEEVMVSEFVTGRTVQDILEAMDRRDEKYLGDMERDGIEPKRLAKQLVRSRYYSFHECPLFHGDPHPANILVQPNNRIVMIDFGACGVFSERDRNLFWQLNRHYSKEDVGGMVNMLIALMEPLDPVRGVFQFKKDLVDAWWTGFYGIKSKHAQWWERSSSRLWLKYFELMRKHQVPVPRNMVRMIRATLLYDTIAAMLYPEINVFDEFQKYSEGVAKRTRRRMEKCAVRQMLLGPDDSMFLKLQQVVDVGNGVLNRVQRYLDDPKINFAAIAGKIYSAIRAFIRMLLLGGGLLVAGLVVAAIAHFSSASAESRLLRQVGALLPQTAFSRVLTAFWTVSGLVLIFVYGRRVYLRFGDVDD